MKFISCKLGEFKSSKINENYPLQTGEFKPSNIYWKTYL